MKVYDVRRSLLIRGEVVRGLLCGRGPHWFKSGPYDVEVPLEQGGIARVSTMGCGKGYQSIDPKYTNNPEIHGV